MKIEVTKNPKRYNEFRFKGTATAGQILCIMNALERYKESPLAEEVLGDLKRATTDINGHTTLKV